MSSIPVLFVGKYQHEKGELPYLSNALVQAKKSGNELILLGQSHDLADQCYPLENYETSALEFDKVYQHMTFNAFGREIMAFRRWFIVRDFMKKEGIRKLFLCENDVLLYANISTLLADYDKSALCTPIDQAELDWCSSGHCALWFYDDVDYLCDLSLQYYNDKLDVLKKKWQYHQDHKLAGGICDMTLLYFLTKERELENLNVVKNGCVFDHNISVSDNAYKGEYELDACRIKKTYLSNGRYAINNMLTNDLVVANTLHFSGTAKNFLPLFGSEFLMNFHLLRTVLVAMSKLKNRYL